MNTFRHTLTAGQASNLATLALHCIQQEFPYQPAHVITNEADLRRPRSLHPAFYGCFDWHSAVHGHWLASFALHMLECAELANRVRVSVNRGAIGLKRTRP
ncbi:MAG TPA: DUF2891 family protein [Aggregatilineaceae bacterium]|nr:DUF2891 family protein [Aggregatilineaceae bacterium]